MADVFISDIAEISEVDDSVEFVGDNGETSYSVPAPKLKKYTQQGISNPNLLDNWYFGNPVNQRGSTEYVSTTESGMYTIDRWKGRNGAYKLTIQDDSIKIESTSNYGTYFEQNFENSIINKKCIASVLVKSITGVCYIQPIYKDGSSESAITLKEGLNVLNYRDDKEIAKILLQVNSGAILELIAVKLELGDVQTLAHQDSIGNWVLNEIPNYAEQLARCQRYSVAYSTVGTGFYWHIVAISNTRAYVYIPLPQNIRALPAITFDTEKLTLRLGDQEYTISNVGLYTVTGNGLILRIDSENLEVGSTYILRSNDRSIIIISADL